MNWRTTEGDVHLVADVIRESGLLPPEKIDQEKPDFIFILPWNLKDEIMEQMSDVRAFGCKFVVPIPETTVHD